MTAYRAFGAEQLSRVLDIYRDAGWSAYLGDEEKLDRAFTQSLCILGAFQEEKLIGFIRCVGDGEHIVYVQDLIVDSGHRRQGIGRELLRRVMGAYAHVRMLALATDAADRDSTAFYTAMGMRPYGDAGIAGYLR